LQGLQILQPFEEEAATGSEVATIAEHPSQLREPSNLVSYFIVFKQPAGSIRGESCNKFKNILPKIAITRAWSRSQQQPSSLSLARFEDCLLGIFKA
jgi:hypothetical protein